MQADVPGVDPRGRLWAAQGAGVTLGGIHASAVPWQVSGVGYNGKGTVCLLPSKEVIKEFSNVSVGKLVEVSQGSGVRCAQTRGQWSWTCWFLAPLGHTQVRLPRWKQRAGNRESRDWPLERGRAL